MSDNGRRYAPKDATPRSQNSREFKLNLSEDQLNHTDELEDLQGYAGSRAPQRVEESSAGARSARAERNQKKEAKEHKKRNRVKARKNKRIFAFTWLAMVILVSLTLASYLIGGSNDFLGVDRMDSEVEVTIPENVTQEQLTDILYKSHAIDKPEFFSLFCKFTTEMEYFEPGTYTIKTNYDYKQLVNTLQSGPDLGEEITVMFREGITVQQLAALLEENGLHTADEILEACNSSDYDSYSDVAAITNQVTATISSRAICSRIRTSSLKTIR